MSNAYSPMAYEPKVTIIIPVYNGEKYVKYAIESALNQSYKNLEVLVINDGSKDATEAAVQPYLSRVRYIAKENGGVSSVLNLALKEMTGEWLSWLSHDDVYLPDKVTSQIRTLNTLLETHPEQPPEHYILSCQDERIDETGHRLPRGGSTHPAYTDQYDFVAKEISRYTIGGCTVLGSRSAYLAVGGFDEANRTVSDADMWFKLALAGYEFVFSNDVYVQARYHKDMVSVKRSGLVQEEKDAFYTGAILSVAGHVDADAMQNITLSMVKAGLPRAAKTAQAQFTGNQRKLKLLIAKAKVMSRAKGILRTVYRKLRWG